MDLTPYLPWLRFAHIVGAFLFVGGHGVSTAMALRLRHEREPARMLAILDLSASSIGLATIGMLVLLVAGIVDGIVGGSFGRLWIWVALVVFVGTGIAMTPLASGHFNAIRAALGQRTRAMKATDPDPVPLPIDQTIALAAGPRPMQVATFGGIALVVLLWLMTFKPF
ncbi:MAG TPA: DUF2269 family protein [Candidatus Limnocylindrales bacterium]|jgi:hypothetical protein